MVNSPLTIKSIAVLFWRVRNRRSAWKRIPLGRITPYMRIQGTTYAYISPPASTYHADTHPSVKILDVCLLYFSRFFWLHDFFVIADFFTNTIFPKLAAVGGASRAVGHSSIPSRPDATSASKRLVFRPGILGISCAVRGLDEYARWLKGRQKCLKRIFQPFWPRFGTS